jgi:hypothetical protein
MGSGSWEILLVGNFACARQYICWVQGGVAGLLSCYCAGMSDSSSYLASHYSDIGAAAPRGEWRRWHALWWSGLEDFTSTGPAFELVFKIGATSLRREGSSVGPTWTSWGRYEEFPWWLFLWWSRSRQLVEEWWWCHLWATSATTLVFCGGARLIARVTVSALTTIVFHDDQRGCLYWVLVDFWLINRPTLFFLINKNDKYFALFQK